MPKTARTTGAKSGRKKKRIQGAAARKLPPHRPTKYLGEISDKIAYRCALCEGSQAELARNLCIDDSQIPFWFKKYPSFYDAWQKGKLSLKENSFVSLEKRIKGFRYVERETKVDKDRKETQVIRSKVALPDVQAAIYVITRHDKVTDPDNENKIDEMINDMQNIPTDFFEKLLAYRRSKAQNGDDDKGES